MSKPTFKSRLLSGITCILLLSAIGSTGYGAVPFGVSPPSGKQWTLTFDDEFTEDASLSTNKWNGGAGGTDWCNLDFHGKTGGGYMFNQAGDPCGQHVGWSGCAVGHRLSKGRGRRQAFFVLITERSVV